MNVNLIPLHGYKELYGESPYGVAFFAWWEHTETLEAFDSNRLDESAQIARSHAGQPQWAPIAVVLDKFASTCDDVLRERAAAEQAEQAETLSDATQLSIDILTTAVECAYGWFQFSDICRNGDGDIRQVNVRDVGDTFDGGDPGPWHVITDGDVRRAMRKLASEADTDATRKFWRSLVRSPEDADYDANDADCILQMAVLGSIVYA